jgi:glycosyltransferase involved in cell wall biosynthesis
MKIAVNTRLLLPGKLEGIGWFTYEIFKRLSQRHPEIEWVFLFDRAFDAQFIFNENVRPLVGGPPSRHPVLWYWWFQFTIPRLLKKSAANLFISPDGYLPTKPSIPSIPVIHDINFHHQKDNLDRIAGAYMRHYFPLFARAGARVATVSEYSKNDIAETYQVPKDKIDVVYNGVGDFFKVIGAKKRQSMRNKLSDGKPYFVFVGALNPRKNIDGMLAAYQIYRQRGGQAHFVVVGNKMLWNESLKRSIEEHPYQSDIHFTGRLEGEALNEVLGAAQALAFVSHFEGFGIPILEAFKSEVPVITANNSSMPEVSGDAALLCDSRDPQNIAEAYLKTDRAETRKTLIEKGLQQVKHFNWERSADMMWASIEKTIS